MRDTNIIEMAREAGIVGNFWPELERLAELIRADERARVTNVLLEMHDNAAPPHPYYKHAALEINRK